MERGWVGRIEGDRVVQPAAQTLQAFFTGGGTAREHAEFPLDEVKLLAPVLHPPSIPIFDEQDGCAFANPAAIVDPGRLRSTAPREPVTSAHKRGWRSSHGSRPGTEPRASRRAYTLLAEWRRSARRPPKDRDFALGLGPVAVTTDASTERADDRRPLRGFERDAAPVALAAVELGARGHQRLPRRHSAAEPAVSVEDGSPVEIEIEEAGALEQRLAG